MRVLITGGYGFVGQHLCKELLAHGHKPFLLGNQVPDGEATAPFFQCDIRIQGDLSRIMAEVAPEAVVHLAGISHVVVGAKDPALLTDINVVGTQRVAAAMATTLPAKAPLLIASSATVYGNHSPGDRMVSSTTPVHADSAYAQSKLAAEYVALAFQGTLNVFVTRPFNHIGPGQDSSFVCSSFAQKIKKARHDDRIPVGDLEAFRDFTDVRDIVRAYRLIIEQQPDHKTFVLGSGKAVRIREIFDQLVATAGKKVSPEVRTELLRSQEHFKTVAEITEASAILGWTPKISLSETLRDIYEAIK
jgi:nucleoside-diphosphate-sugar epimerase